MTLKLRVYHASYGCDTGCCGHTLEIEDDSGTSELFEFDHPSACATDVQKRAWAREVFEKQLARERPDCVASIDWDSLDVSEAFDC